MSPRVEFEEVTAQHGVESVPLSHLSIELGHLYAEDFGPGNDYLDRHFARIVPWVRSAREACQEQLPRGTKARISTCFMIDDYFNRFGSPPEIIRVLQEKALVHGLTIDYIAREAGCAQANRIPLAKLVLDRLVADPVPETTGGRPPATESGWLCNGQRTPGANIAPAMNAAAVWAPPAENGSNQHSIFVDVQLYSEELEKRTWSCSFLASVWQLLRLGLLRHLGAAVVRPTLIETGSEISTDWDSLPAVMQVNASAAPFSAYETMSLLNPRFQSVEFAVRTILSQMSIDVAVVEQIAKRSKDEGIDLSDELVNRIGYVFR